MRRRRPAAFYVATAGAVLSGLGAFYCGMGYAMTGSFAVAHDATREQVGGVALFWAISALALACLPVCLVFVVVRLSSRGKDAWVKVLALAAGLLCTACGTRTPALDTAMEAYPALGIGIYEDLGRWEAVLGEPERVPQVDGGTTFFYWPERGIAVFTHPQYEGQFQHKDQEERKVTSVILPLRQSFHPSFLPVEDHVEVQFTELLDLQHLLPDSNPAPRRAHFAETVPVDLVSSPWRKTIERLHILDGEPIAIEVRDTWWLSHYD